jgi:hypothetical protein
MDLLISKQVCLSADRAAKIGIQAVTSSKASLCLRVLKMHPDSKYHKRLRLFIVK